MKTTQWMTTLILATCLTLSAFAEKPEGKRPERDEGREARRERMLKKFDADGDGKLSESERASARETMERRKTMADTDGDGKVSEAEREAAKAEMMKKLDTNGDGEVSEEERKAGRKGRGPKPTGA